MGDRGEMHSQIALTAFGKFVLPHFFCRCGRENCRTITVDRRLAEGIGTLAVRLPRSKDLVVTSGFRCKAHNDEIKGSAKNSRHMRGEAVDVKVVGLNPREVYELIVEDLSIEQFIRGAIGVYAGSRQFLHLDVRSGPHRFGYIDYTAVPIEEALREYAR